METGQIHRIALLSSAYLGPVQYYAKIISYDLILIERFETYHKQSYRNRCIIYGANGPLVLSIPVFEGPRAKAPMRELQLTYDHNWQQIHWRSIMSAYKNSPFFEYYADDLAPYYHEKKWKYLIDFNSGIQEVIFDAINYKPLIEYTDQYVKIGNIAEGTNDFRYSIHPKSHRQGIDNEFHATPYHQVFNDQSTFAPNLSILDLLFNEGPETLTILRSCINQLESREL
jgi:hypothetical protein